MSGFRHVIATRFNVRLPEYPVAATSAWLSHRFDLFERFCLPSVRSQTNQNFDWLVLCDPGMPAEFKNRLEAYRHSGSFHPVYADGRFCQAMVQRAVAPFLTAPHLITTRLDNDDAICRTFVETVQNCFAAQNFEFLNFPHGYIWKDGQLYRGQHWTNSFISLIERAQNVSTVYNGNHMRLKELGPIRQIGNGPGWLQVIHRHNLANHVWGAPRPIEELFADFGIAPESLRAP